MFRCDCGLNCPVCEVDYLKKLAEQDNTPFECPLCHMIICGECRGLILSADNSEFVQPAPPSPEDSQHARCCTGFYEPWLP